MNTNTTSIWDKPRSFMDWFLFQGYSGDSLGILRLYFGLGLIPYHYLQFKGLLRLDAFGESFHYIERIWYFDLLGITHYAPWLTLPVFALLLTATLLFALGKWTRPAIIITILCIFYLKGCRDSFSGDVHHRYIVPVSILFLFLVSKCAEIWSLDSRHKAFEKLQEWEASWPIRTAQTLIAMYYFWALAAKYRVSGFAWFEPVGRIHEKLLDRTFRYGPDADYLPLAYEIAQNAELVFAFGILVIVFEFFAPIVLFWRRLWVKLIFIASATTFHTFNYILMNVKFHFFPILFIFFFDPASFHKKLLDKMSERRRQLAFRLLIFLIFIPLVRRIYEQFT